MGESYDSDDHLLLGVDAALSERRRMLRAVCRRSRGLSRAERSSSRAARGSEGGDARGAPSTESQHRRCTAGMDEAPMPGRRSGGDCLGRFAEVRGVYPERQEVVAERPVVPKAAMLEARHRRNRGIDDARLWMQRRCRVVGTAESAWGGLQMFAGTVQSGAK